MKLIFTILIIGFLNLAIASEDKVLNDENYINDDQYYKKGINFYENGLKNHLLFFLIFQRKGIKTRYIICPICFMKVLEQYKTSSCL